MVCHEFRTPLAIIDGNASRLQRRIATMPEARRDETLSDIRSGVKRLVGLIETVLSASRLEAGSIEFKPRSFDLRAMVAEVAASHGDLAIDHQIEIDIDALPQSFHGDENLLRQAVSNLISKRSNTPPAPPR